MAHLFVIDRADDASATVTPGSTGDGATAADLIADLLPETDL